jgi:ADP-heptose:LPS heptosyltransferase
MLQRCVAFVGHDSGISHLAAALGKPCLVLWPATPEELWRPQGQHVTILHEPAGLRQLTAERVFSELQKILNCLESKTG